MGLGLALERARHSKMKLKAEKKEMDPGQLRESLLHSLRLQGFSIGRDGRIVAVSGHDKDAIRRLHTAACQASIARAKGGLQRHEERLIRNFADGSEIEPEAIHPEIVEIQSGTEEELLFRYARLHWSIPVSAGYGRR